MVAIDPAFFLSAYPAIGTHTDHAEPDHLLVFTVWLGRWSDLSKWNLYLDTYWRIFVVWLLCARQLRW